MSTFCEQHPRSICAVVVLCCDALCFQHHSDMQAVLDALGACTLSTPLSSIMATRRTMRQDSCASDVSAYDSQPSETGRSEVDDELECESMRVCVISACTWSNFVGHSAAVRAEYDSQHNVDYGRCMTIAELGRAQSSAISEINEIFEVIVPIAET